jgi:hypothetical protein
VQDEAQRSTTGEGETTMALHMLGKDPNSPDGKSPTVYYDDQTDT